MVWGKGADGSAGAPDENASPDAIADAAAVKVVRACAVKIMDKCKVFGESGALEDDALFPGVPKKRLKAISVRLLFSPPGFAEGQPWHLDYAKNFNTVETVFVGLQRTPVEDGNCTEILMPGLPVPHVPRGRSESEHMGELL